MSRRRRARTQDAIRPLPVPDQWFGVHRFRRAAVWDDEDEQPVRTPALAKSLISLVNECPEAATALEVSCAYVLGSGTGDELGFAVVSPDPTTEAIARALLSRCFDLFDYWQIIWRLLAWGDAFAAYQINLAAKQVDSVMLLPTWQVFCLPGKDGRLSHYEQADPTSFQNSTRIEPEVMVHWAYNKRHLYGRSVFREALADWRYLQQADVDLAEAAQTLTYQPNVHIMPPGADEAYKRAYKADHEAKKLEGLIPDVYLLQGAEVRKPAGLPATFPLIAFLDHHKLRRLRIASRSRVPLYLLGIESKYAREIAYQPALAFVVHVGSIRQLFAAGLRKLIDVELALNDITSSSYQILFPKINVNPWQPAIDDELDEPGVEDVGEDE